MKSKIKLFPKAERILVQVGEQIKLARLRRDMSIAELAERSKISKSTILLIEKGSPSTSIGAYMQALFVLGLEADFLYLARDDELGRRLQDAKLVTRKRASKKGDQ